MLFNSLQFLWFFPLVTFLYFLLPHKHRWKLLLIASYYFYMCWKAEYIILIIVSTLIDYYAGLMMGKSESKHRRRLFLILSLCSNLGLLFAFKYFNFFNESMRAIFNTFNLFYDVPALKILLPVGISFYTFQTLSYTIDVYKGDREPEKNLGIFALYVSFFPQLVAGPIERSVQLMPQFYRHVTIDYKRITDGLKLMLWGFFKKIVIADRLAHLVNLVYNNPHDYQGLPLIIATYFFAFQIYCDFSGYSDIAIGASQVLGFNLMDNFNRPYFSKSISEFWRRWHISLSSWFRDYLYIPLGGSRATKSRWYFNMFFVFMVSGLWHGANWTFVIWGMLHGFYLIFSIVSKDWRRKFLTLCKVKPYSFTDNLIKVLITFHLVLFAWVFFRANSVSDAFYIISNLIPDNISSNITIFCQDVASREYGIGWGYFIISLCAIAFMELIHLLQRHNGIRHMLAQKPLLLRWSVYYAMILFIFLFGVFKKVQFIYFQF